MGRSKINFGDETLIDLTEDTVTPDALLEGVTAHDAAGEQIEGTLVPGDMTAAVYDPQGKAQDIFAYVDDAVSPVAQAASGAASAASAAQRQATSASSAASSAQSAARSAQSAASAAQSTASGKLSPSGDGSNLTSGITLPSSRSNLTAGAKLSVMFGKIYRYFADLGTLAFKSSVAKSDLAADVPLLPDVTADDNGKFLRVVGGAWAAVEIENANGGAF